MADQPTTQPSVSQQASVVDQATLKRSIQMKFFADDKLKAKVVYDYEQNGHDAVKASVTCGQIIGRIFSVKEVSFPSKDDTKPPQINLCAIGDFEGVNYATGEVFSSTAAYLPGYYLETVAEQMKKPEVFDIVFAVEIVLVPTGKGIPFTYEVRPIVERTPDDPLVALKRELSKSKKLRLPFNEPETPTPALVHSPAVSDATKQPAHKASDQPAQPQTQTEPATT